MRNFVRCSVLIMLLSVTSVIFHSLCADDDRHGRRHRYRSGSHEGVHEKHGPNRAPHLPPETDQAYKEACGACHFAYQPGLLPSGSWIKILSHLKDHFGETVEIDAGPKGVIQNYLVDNAAETSQWKRSRKIVRCLKGKTPLRITEIPYILRKHRKLPPDVFARKSVGSMSNCSACHRTADQGIYEDDNVTIPE